MIRKALKRINEDKQVLKIINQNPNHQDFKYKKVRKK